MGGGSSIGSVVIKGGSFTGSSGIVNQEQGQDLGNGTIEISGGTFSHDVGEFCATGYACAKDSDNKYVVNVADGAQVSTDKDESGNVIATVDGNYSGGETPRVAATAASPPTIPARLRLMCLPTMVGKLLLAQQLKLRSVPMP